MNFLDTYALVELLRGDADAGIIDEEWCTLRQNLAELAYARIRDGQGTDVEELVAALAVNARSLPTELIAGAMGFRHTQRKRKLSYIDALGYIYARKNGMAFVTGDKAFRDLPGVRFIGKKKKSEA